MIRIVEVVEIYRPVTGGMDEIEVKDIYRGVGPARTSEGCRGISSGHKKRDALTSRSSKLNLPLFDQIPRQSLLIVRGKSRRQDHLHCRAGVVRDLPFSEGRDAAS